MAKVVHLARRFFGSLRPGRPPAADLVWVEDHLSAAELAIWGAMSDPDQRHSVEVARTVDKEVRRRDTEVAGGTSGDWSVLADWFDSVEHRRQMMVAAALLHDSGKNLSGLGTFARVGATLLRPALSAQSRAALIERSGLTQRFSRYWRHPELGSAALKQVHSHRLVACWAAEHHWPAEDWSVPPELGFILRDCDND
ncbi:MAG: hypothetical protein OER95_07000 [Acidimicrobiia bacterium]|nr:hypothetical protein [Acidimicrobiia bacterium]